MLIVAVKLDYFAVCLSMRHMACVFATVVLRELFKLNNIIKDGDQQRFTFM